MAAAAGLRDREGGGGQGRWGGEWRPLATCRVAALQGNEVMAEVGLRWNAEQECVEFR